MSGLHALWRAPQGLLLDMKMPGFLADKRILRIQRAQARAASFFPLCQQYKSLYDSPVCKKSVEAVAMISLAYLSCACAERCNVYLL